MSLALNRFGSHSPLRAAGIVYSHGPAARAAGIDATITNHTWRATGITNFLENGGSLEMAQYMAGHADPRTTQLYDRRQKQATRSEVERIRYEKKSQP